MQNLSFSHLRSRAASSRQGGADATKVLKTVSISLLVGLSICENRTQPSAHPIHIGYLSETSCRQQTVQPGAPTRLEITRLRNSLLLDVVLSLHLDDTRTQQAPRNNSSELPREAERGTHATSSCRAGVDAASEPCFTGLHIDGLERSASPKAWRFMDARPTAVPINL